MKDEKGNKFPVNPIYDMDETIEAMNNGTIKAE
jgi:hypothetical protein